MLESRFCWSWHICHMFFCDVSHDRSLSWITWNLEKADFEGNLSVGYPKTEWEHTNWARANYINLSELVSPHMFCFWQIPQSESLDGCFVFVHGKKRKIFGGLEHECYCSIQLGMSSSQFMKSFFSEGLFETTNQKLLQTNIGHYLPWKSSIIYHDLDYLVYKPNHDV